MKLRAVSFDDAASKRIERAATFEKRLRLEAILNLETNVACFTLRQPTVQDILKFEYVENRLVTGEEPQVDDYLHLVYTLHTGSTDKRFISKAAKLIAFSSSIRKELSCFFSACFNDMPSLGVPQSESITRYDSSVWLCTLIDTLANEYGWTLKEILELPISTGLQLAQRILKRIMGDKYAMRNGITQQAKAEIMKEILSNGDSGTTG
jgi:hypothetical protein